MVQNISQTHSSMCSYLKFASVDRLPAHTIVVGEIAALRKASDVVKLMRRRLVNLLMSLLVQACNAKRIV